MADDFGDWTSAFYNRMRSNPTSFTTPITTHRGATLADLLTASQQPVSAGVALHPDPIQSEPNAFQRAMDIVSRPLYGAANLVDAIINDTSSDPNDKFQDPLAEAWKGITGEDKTTFGQIVNERTTLPGWAKFGVGLAGDIALDPLNLIPGAAIATGAKAVRGAVTGTRATEKTLQEAAKVAASARDAEAASDLAAKKVTEAQETGTNVDPSITDQVLHDAKTATTPKGFDEIQKMLDDLSAPPPVQPSYAEEIANQIGGNQYLDPTTGVPGAQLSRLVLDSTTHGKLIDDLVNVQTPDDMKAFRAMYKSHYSPQEYKGLAAARSIPRFKELAQNFIGRGIPETDTNVADIVMAPERYHPQTVSALMREHDVANPEEFAHKYRFTPDSFEQKAQTIQSEPIAKLNEVLKKQAEAPAPVATAANDIKDAAKVAEQSAKKSEKTQTQTRPPRDYGNEQQGNAVQKFVREANVDNRENGLSGPDAWEYTRGRALERGDTVEKVARSQGDDPFIHVGPLAADTRKFNISTNQVMRTLADESPEHAALLDRSLFNASTGIGTEGFQQAAAEAMRQYDDWLMDPINARSGVWPPEDGSATMKIWEAMNNATDSEYMKRWTHPTGSPKQQAYYKKMMPVMKQNQIEMAQALQDIAPKLSDIAASNIAARQASNVVDAKTITESVGAGIDHSVDAGQAVAIENASNVTNSIKDASETVGASPKASYEAAANIATQLQEKYGVTQEQLRNLRQTAEARARSGNAANPQVQRMAREQAKADAKEADAVGVEALGVEYTRDISQQFNAQFTNSFMKIMAPFGRAFSYGYKAGELATILKEGRSAAYTIGKRYERLLTSITKSSNKEEQVEMVKRIRMGDKPIEGAPDRPLYDAIKESLDITYDTAAFHGRSDSGLFTNWFAQGIPVGEMNKAFAAVGLTHRFKEVDAGHWSEIPNQWRDWTIDDPVDFAHKSFEAMQRVASNKAVATHAASKWGVRKVPSGAKGGDWVKLVDKSNDSSILPYMDTSLYYPKELAEQIANLDWLMKQSVSFAGNNTSIGKFVRNVVDPYMQLWKPLITIAKPGHHLRNITGDFFITALDMQFRKIGPAYAKAGRILYGNKAFEGAQAITQTGQLVEKIGPNAGKERVGVTLRGGQKVMLDDPNMYKLGFQRGLFPEFTKSEDLIRNEGTGLLSKAAEGLTTSKPMQKVGAFAEFSSHVGRMAHFIALMERPSFTRKFSSLEEASRAAAERVKKFHPDTSGLAPFEQKYMRRIIPFYTWFRQSSPVVMGAVFTRPGRIMAVPKIQYNMALQMGVDPNSIGDPFPDGHVYPSWVRDSMTGPIGPGGNMMNLGSPQEGFLPDYFSSNPLRSLANQLNPILKQPYEAITDTKVQTGTPISDKSEFWDQIIPGATTLSQLTSTSPMGTFGNLATGEGLDPLRSVQQGDQNRWWNRSLANFFTGLGLTNVRTPTAQTSAFHEQQGR